MKILFVAPRNNLLLVDAETQDILSYGLNITPLLGDVSQQDLLRKVTQSSYDILWLATHGSKEGILLSDGILPSGQLTSLVRNKFDAVFLNTCDSIETAQLLQNETSATIICTISQVPDASAYHTGSMLAYWLSQSYSLTDAYHNSKPGGNKDYLLLSGTGKKKWMINLMID